MSLTVALFVAALTGFVSLSYEILWFRVFSFVSAGAASVFGIVLGMYLTGLAAGAVVSRRFVDQPRERGAPEQLRTVALALGLSALAGYIVLPATAWLAARDMWQGGLLLVGLASGMFGVVLPVLSHLGIAPTHAAGARLSYLYLANVVGSAVGSLLTGLVLTDIWSIEAIARSLVLLGIALATAVALGIPRAKDGSARAPRVVGLAVAAVAAILLTERPLFAQLYERLLYKRAVASMPAFVERQESRSGVVTVAADGAVYGGGAYDGFISTDLVRDRNLLVRAYAVHAIHPRPSRVLVIGLSTGAWTEVLRTLPGVDHITAVEINRGYLSVIARHPQVRGLLTDPRVSIVIDDGRRWLNRHPNERFDAIVMNTTWHWRAHVTNLLSAEFLSLARAHLAPGGVFYFNTTYSPDAMKTAGAVFPHVLRVVNFVAGSDAPIVFDAAKWQRFLPALRRPDGSRAFDPADPYAMARLDTLLALPSSLAEPPTRYGLEGRESLLRGVADARVITDDNMISEWRGTQPGYPRAESDGAR
jgi:spermidine synthase